MIAIVCGDREWCAPNVIENAISYFMLHGGLTKIIVGGCRGADHIAACVARRFGIEVVEMHADWTKYSKRAGPIRNRQMLDLLRSESDAPLVIAFHDKLDDSLGTRDMVNVARHFGVSAVIISSSGERTSLPSIS